ncbi:hypothetical protein NUU61_004674 [Penicillium alfredii]|uniref:Cystathionine gamma-synthase n=1 Tax=Penicillium alfredii TaxID=1506179 RepID=A0A9W9F834_9EURO|nr:uncharacterized protein NUU61_004674 [Penicillium alfredii]KAJ5095318.1 hypothetical protein NUU61_004674 [Penicillium alfredii]
MDSECEDPQFCTAGPRSDLNGMTLPDWVDSATKEKFEIRSRLAVLARSAQFNQKPLRPEDVFLYPTGMAAISAVARSLAQSEEDSGAVVYGWPYAGTPHSVRTSGFNRFTMYGHGTTDELDELKSSLASGTKITVLFCEIPSNPQLSTPDLLHIRDLANKFRFIVVCDDTLATSVNMDIMPYVDVTVTSLTKIFSGGGNVMGGSLMVNPASQHYDKLHSLLSNSYEDLYFPPDAMTMAKNSRDFVERVHRCNESTLRIANLLTTHSSVEYVNHPTTVSSAPIYERYRRENGGYGFLLSVVFRNPGSAEVFYDTLDVWKGPTIGTNASIAIPYSLLAHAREGDWAASHGIPRHIVRLSVGLEDFTDLKTRVNRALHRVEQWEEERKSADPDGTAASGCAIL